VIGGDFFPSGTTAAVVGWLFVALAAVWGVVGWVIALFKGYRATYLVGVGVFLLAALTCALPFAFEGYGPKRFADSLAGVLFFATPIAAIVATVFRARSGS
jgi:hypothetical protein